MGVGERWVMGKMGKSGCWREVGDVKYGLVLGGDG